MIAIYFLAIPIFIPNTTNKSDFSYAKCRKISTACNVQLENGIFAMGGSLLPRIKEVIEPM